MIWLLVFVFVGFLLPQAAGFNPGLDHDGYRAYLIRTGEDAKDLSAIWATLDAVGAVDIGLGSGNQSNDRIRVAVPAKRVHQLEDLGLDAELLAENIGSVNSPGGPFEPYDRPLNGSAPSQGWFNAYHLHDDHLTFHQDLVAAFPNNTEMIFAGQSYQGRPIWGIHIWGNQTKGTMPAIYFHGTSHAREWIAGPVLEYFAYSMLTNYNIDSTTYDLLNKFDYYILPIINPDGLVYSQSSNRLHRKSMQPRPKTGCFGTDLNRNWPYKWDVDGGASTSACSEIYRGAYPGDTPEIASLVNYTSALVAQTSPFGGIRLFIDWHSYGQYVLTPYGYDCDVQPKNNADQQRLASEFARAIKALYGTEYTYGPGCSTLYKTSGTSTDYMADVANVTYSWVVELRPPSRDPLGFALPKDQILAASVEIWQGLRYLLNLI